MFEYNIYKEKREDQSLNSFRILSSELTDEAKGTTMCLWNVLIYKQHTSIVSFVKKKNEFLNLILVMNLIWQVLWIFWSGKVCTVSPEVLTFWMLTGNEVYWYPVAGDWTLDLQHLERCFPTDLSVSVNYIILAVSTQAHIVNLLHVWTYSSLK